MEASRQPEHWISISDVEAENKAERTGKSVGF